jgi:putative transposase
MIPGMTICSAVQLRPSQSEEKWSGFTYFNASADHFAKHQINHACRKAGIGPTTYYRWKALQQDPVSNEQLRIAKLESEVGRLKLLVAELALDRRMLQEALKKN